MTRIDLTNAGHTEDEQRRTTPRRAAVWVVPDPQFPAKTPAGRQLSTPASAPGGQPGSSPQPGVSHGGQLRWVRGLDDGHLHLLAPAEVVTAAAKGHAQALCGQWLRAEGLTIPHGLTGTLCMSCLAGVSATSTDPDPRGGTPDNPIRATDGVVVAVPDATPGGRREPRHYPAGPREVPGGD